MKLFLAGATGAIGQRLVPLLVTGGHHVVATTRSPGKVDSLRAAGAEPVVLDALDRDAVRKAVVSARPDVVVHQMTALGNIRSFRNFDKEFAMTNRLRAEGTDYLLAGARAAGARAFVAQSYSGWPNVRTGGRVKTEDDPLDPHPPMAMTRTLDAIRHLETTVAGASDITGIVLRYGSFYGPGTSIAPDGDVVTLVRQRKFPIIGGGAGVWSFLHIDDAANATRLAIEAGRAGVFNIVDDEPAEVSIWLPELARAIGAKPPYRVPAWIGRLLIGATGVSLMTAVRGSSNAKAKRLLGWQPIHASWREGFVTW
jgi:nucleoside-diphosphate-sugar epimerase